MELTTTNIRKALTKKAMIAWMEDQPEEKRFAPGSPCACMYHDMLCEVFDIEYAYPTYERIEVGDEEVRINANGFAQKFQKAAASFAWKQGLNGIAVPHFDGNRTISRDEAIEIAKGI